MKDTKKHVLIFSKEIVGYSTENSLQKAEVEIGNLKSCITNQARVDGSLVWSSRGESYERPLDTECSLGMSKTLFYGLDVKYNTVIPSSFSHHL